MDSIHAFDSQTSHILFLVCVDEMAVYNIKPNGGLQKNIDYDLSKYLYQIIEPYRFDLEGYDADLDYKNHILVVGDKGVKYNMLHKNISDGVTSFDIEEIH